MPNKLPVVVLIGRPNVGKSMLFNRLSGTRKAITSPIPGTTRDRLYAIIEWNGKFFRLADTAGMFFDPHNEITVDILNQVEMAISEADLLLFLVDNKTGVLPADQKVADLLRKKGKKTILLVNKTDNEFSEKQIHEFHKLGLGEPMSISALSGRKTGDLLDKITECIDFKKEKKGPENSFTISIVGRPNVGKSTLLNTLLGDQRVSVSNIPGTTRDAVDEELQIDGENYTLIDTAGIRRKGKIGKGIENYSVLRALSSIERSEIAILVIDAAEGITHQDKILLGEILEQKKGVLILANKWDLVQEKAKEQGEITEEVFKDFERVLKLELKFATWIPVITISALTKKIVSKLWEEVKNIKNSLQLNCHQSELNKRLLYWKQQAPMPISKGKNLRLVGVKQTSTKPPKFTFRVNDPKLVHFSYERFLENQLRKDFQITNIPVILEFKKASFQK